LFPILATLQLTVLATLGAYGLFIVERDRRRQIKYLKHPVVILMLALFFQMVLSVPGSLWPGGSFGFLQSDFIRTLVFVLLLAASVRAFVDVERLAAVQVLGAAVYSVMVLASSSSSASDRAGGFGGYDPNDYSMLLVCTIPMGVYFLARARTGVGRGLAAIAVLLGTVTIVRSGSRAGFLGLLVVFVYLLLAYRGLPWRIRTAAVAVGLLGLALVASDRYWERMSTLVNLEEDYNWAGRSYTGRIEIWKRGIGYMLQRPFFGVGVARFSSAEGRLSPKAEGPDYGRGWKWSSPHNSFVEVGAELGVVGLAIFVGMLGFAFRALARAARSPPGVSRIMPQAAMAGALAAGMIGYVVVGFFLSHAYSAFMYSLLAMVVGLAKVTCTVLPRSMMMRPRTVPTAVQTLSSVNLRPLRSSR
jgi:O-antigen ligase